MRYIVEAIKKSLILRSAQSGVSKDVSRRSK